MQVTHLVLWQRLLHIGLPIAVALFVCIAIWQVVATRRRLVRTRKRLSLTKKQLDTEVRVRKDANTPYFDLQLLIENNGVVQDTSFLVLANWGQTPALDVEVGLIAKEKDFDTFQITQFTTILPKERKAFLLNYPLPPAPEETEIYVRYKANSGKRYYQSWMHADGKFKAGQLPKLEGGE